MDKSKVCITKAMKVAAASPCSKKQNLLVFDKRDPCYAKPKRKEFYTVSPLTSPAAKQIKVCTGADLKRMCKPKLCHCPPKKRMGPYECFMKMVGSTFKAGLAAAIVYWTYEIGLWGPPTQTEQIYFEMCHAVCESTKLDPEEARRKQEKLMEACPILKQSTTCPKDYSIDTECCKYPPNFEQTYFKMQQFWNCGVTCFFDFLANGPQRVQEFWVWANERYDKLINKSQPESCANAKDREKEKEKEKIAAMCKSKRS